MNNFVSWSMLLFSFITVIIINKIRLQKKQKAKICQVKMKKKFMFQKYCQIFQCDTLIGFWNIAFSQWFAFYSPFYNLELNIKIQNAIGNTLFLFERQPFFQLSFYVNNKNEFCEDIVCNMVIGSNDHNTCCIRSGKCDDKSNSGNYDPITDEECGDL